MSLQSLSARQRQILDFISEFLDEHGYPPTVRDIGRAVGITSTSVVDYNLRVLEREGLLRRTRDVSRGIELAEGVGGWRHRLSAVPVVGRIAAGEPIEAIAGDFDHIELSRELVPEGAYALRVKGKSMVEDLIDDGDLVVVKPQESVDNGAIVVALITDSPTGEGQATLKRIYREKNVIRLQPANSAMKPLYVKPEDVRIQGRVVAVIRQLG